jgi:hypothetical protein
MADRRKTITLGIALALAVLAAVASAVWIAVLLFVLAAFLIAWGLEPRRTEVLLRLRIVFFREQADIVAKR